MSNTNQKKLNISLKQHRNFSFEGKEFLTNTQAINFLGISRSGLYTLEQKKKIKRYTLDGLGRIMYKKSELEKLFQLEK